METIDRTNEYPKAVLLDGIDTTVKIRKEDTVELQEVKVLSKTGDLMLTDLGGGNFLRRACYLNTSFKWHLVCDENGYLLLVPTKR